MVTTSRISAAALLIAGLSLGGCGDIFGPDGQTRIFLSQGSASGASLSVSPGEASAERGHGGSGAVLALVERLDVTITAVQAQPAQYIDADEDDQVWETLTLAAPVTVNLLGLPTDEAGLEVLSGDLPAGAYVRIRLLVSEADLTLLAPLTLGRQTFDAGEPIEIDIPSAWVSVPGAYFTVTEEAGAVVNIEFDPSVSLGQLTVGEGGRLRLTPVMRGKR